MTNPVSTSKPPPQASSFPSWSSLIKKLFDYRTWDPMTQAMVASVLFFLVEVGVFSFWHISTKALA